MFNLEQSIHQWKNTLESKEFCTSDIDELENHLREQIDELKVKELDDEESFWIAVKRLGSADVLSIEFEKVNYTEIYKKRMLWALGGMTIFILTNLLYSLIYQVYVISPLVIDLRPQTIFYIILCGSALLTALICYGVFNFIFSANNNRFEKLIAKTFFLNKENKGKLLFYVIISYIVVYFGSSLAYNFLIRPYVNDNAYRFDALPFYKYLAIYQTIWFGFVSCFIFYMFVKLYKRQTCRMILTR